MTADEAQEMADFETAVGDPSAYYAAPQEIVADETLGKAQKLRFLTKWAQDLTDRQTADAEGMVPLDSRATNSDVKALRDVAAAIEEVEASPEDREIAAPRSFWSRSRKLTG